MISHVLFVVSKWGQLGVISQIGVDDINMVKTAYMCYGP